MKLEAMDLEELARYAVTLKGWKWLPGMVDINGIRILYVRPNGEVRTVFDEGGYDAWLAHRTLIGASTNVGDHIPDFRDPATLGCLLAPVREAWGDRGIGIVAEWRPGRGAVSPVTLWGLSGSYPHGSTFRDVARVQHPTEAHALVAALEAA